MTPEGRIKNKINKVLASYGKNVYYYMPVPGGFGKQTVDYLGCAYGRFFAIEAKRPGGKPSERQAGVIEDIDEAQGVTFLINSDDTLEEFNAWLQWAKGIAESW
jgi:hypothetical protein